MRAIETEVDYQNALNRARLLMSCSPDTPEADELEVLATLIKLYENKYFPIGLPDPIAAIQFRLEQLDRSESDIVPIFGSESLVNAVMSKRQPLTLEMIRALHSHLGIPADVLLQLNSDANLTFPLAEPLLGTRRYANRMRIEDAYEGVIFEQKS